MPKIGISIESSNGAKTPKKERANEIHIAQQNKKVTRNNKSILKAVKDNQLSKNNNSSNEVDSDQLNELNLGY